MSDWKTARLHELIEPDRSITYGVVKPGDETPDGIPFIRSGDIMGGSVRLSHLRTISDAVSQAYSRTILRGGELLISLVGNPGEVAIAPVTLRGANIARQVGLVPLSHSVVSNYVMYYLMSPQGRAQLLQRVGGAVQQVINLADLKTIDIPLPDYATQRFIADAISAYDDLIENNRRRIRLLEEAARLLYREWFVRLRFPGHEHTRIEDGLPEGWTRKRIDEEFETVLGGTPSRARPDYWGGTIPWINSGKVNDICIVEPSEYITEAGLAKSAAKMMPRGTTVLAITGATLGQVSRLAIETSGNQSVVGVVDLAGGRSEWLYLTILERIGELVARATGGAQLHINKEIVNELQLILPSTNVLMAFQDQAGPLLEQATVLLQMNRKLREARDLLLPRLMRGEITV